MQRPVDDVESGSRSGAETGGAPISPSAGARVIHASEFAGVDARGPNSFLPSTRTQFRNLAIADITAWTVLLTAGLVYAYNDHLKKWVDNSHNAYALPVFLVADVLIGVATYALMNHYNCCADQPAPTSDVMVPGAAASPHAAAMFSPAASQRAANVAGLGAPLLVGASEPADDDTVTRDVENQTNRLAEVASSHGRFPLFSTLQRSQAMAYGSLAAYGLLVAGGLIYAYSDVVKNAMDSGAGYSDPVSYTKPIFVAFDVIVGVAAGLSKLHSTCCNKVSQPQATNSGHTVALSVTGSPVIPRSADRNIGAANGPAPIAAGHGSVQESGDVVGLGASPGAAAAVGTLGTRGTRDEPVVGLGATPRG